MSSEARRQSWPAGQPPLAGHGCAGPAGTRTHSPAPPALPTWIQSLCHQQRQLFAAGPQVPPEVVLQVFETRAGAGVGFLPRPLPRGLPRRLASVDSPMPACSTAALVTAPPRRRKNLRRVETSPSSRAISSKFGACMMRSLSLVSRQEIPDRLAPSWSGRAHLAVADST